MNYALINYFSISFLILSFNIGTILCKSPTMPKSAALKIGAYLSLLIAMMYPDSSIPAKCWIAPEIPHATYDSGRTVLPVSPTWMQWSTTPASTMARDDATMPPSVSAKACNLLKPSAFFTPMHCAFLSLSFSKC